MFPTGGLLPVEDLPGGTTVLCVGPPLAGKREYILRLLGVDTRGSDATVLVSTDSSSRGVRADYAANVDGERPRLGVVDCTGETYGATVADRDGRTVSSRPELGSVGTALADLLAELDDSGNDGGRVRVGLLSLTSLALGADPDATARFVSAFADLIDRHDGLGVLTVHTDTFRREAVGRLEGLVDATLSVREADDAVEVHLAGLGAPDDWHRVELAGQIRADVAGVDQPSRDRGSSAAPPVASEFDSLAALIASFDERRPTLTVCNRERPDHAFEAVSAYFEGIGVAVRETDLGTEQPRDVALLHRGDEVVAASPLQAIEAGIASEQADADPFAGDRGPAVLEAIDGDVFGAVDMDRQSLIDASTAIEMTAWRAGEGTLHAGFQRLSRYWHSDRSRRVVRRLAEAGVSVHVYGAPDADPDPAHSNVTVHPDPTPEIGHTWFVAYDGGGHPDRRAALVVEERETDRYHGFWTFESNLAASVVSYVADTYLGPDDAREATV
ncbi:MAG: DICT sensory domain-containing protein [Haloarculaceae archaeon]